VLWFGPELWGSGEPLRASSRANNPNPGSAAFADNPGLEVVRRFAERTVIPLIATALLASVLAIRSWLRDRRDSATAFLAAAGFAWLALVAVMTELGYAGNQRYLVVTTAALCVLGGVGAGRIFEGVQTLATRVTGSPGRALAATAAACVLAVAALSPVIRDKADNIDVTLDILRYEASLWDTFPGIVDKGGGRERLLACGNVYSGPFQTQMVAYELGIHGIDVGALGGTPAPGVCSGPTRARPARSCPSSPTTACAWSPPAGAGGSSPPRAPTRAAAPAPPPVPTRRACHRAT